MHGALRTQGGMHMRTSDKARAMAEGLLDKDRTGYTISVVQLVELADEVQRLEALLEKQTAVIAQLKNDIQRDGGIR